MCRLISGISAAPADCFLLSYLYSLKLAEESEISELLTSPNNCISAVMLSTCLTSSSIIQGTFLNN
jgi:hypothetical protein